MTDEERAYTSLQNAIARETLWLTIAIALIALVLGHRPVTKGIILGGLFSVIDFKLMARSIPRKIQSPSRLRLTGNRILRLFVVAVPLVAALKFPYYINFFAVAVGLFLVKIIIFFRYVVLRKS